MKHFDLEPWEEEILEAFEKGEFVSSPTAKEEIEHLKVLAASMLNKQKHVNIRTPESLALLQKQAQKSGTDTLSLEDIEKEIQAVRQPKTRRAYV